LPKTVPFSGKVSLDGKPLSNAVVTLLSQSTGKDVFNSSGTTNEAGEYKLQIVTNQVAQAGAIPGSYRATINRVPAPPSSDKPIDVMGMTLPSRYSDAFFTELKVTVPEAGGTKDFELKSK